MAPAQRLVGGLEDLEAPVGDPEAIEHAIRLYKSRKPLSASDRLYGLLQSGDYPAEAAKLEYYLARVLDDLGLAHSAQRHYLQVVRRGLSSWYVIQAVMKAEVKEELCRKLSAGVENAVVGVEVGARETCVQGSEGQVAVAFKLRAVSDVLD